MAIGSGSSWSDYFRDSLTYRFGSDDSRQCSEPHRQGYACCRHAQSKHRRSPDPGACSGGESGLPDSHFESGYASPWRCRHIILAAIVCACACVHGARPHFQRTSIGRTFSIAHVVVSTSLWSCGLPGPGGPRQSLPKIPGQDTRGVGQGSGHAHR